MTMINAHPGLPEFNYIHLSTAMEASRFLADHHGEALPFLGGTDIFVRMRDGVWKGKYLVDIKGLDGMNQIHFDPNEGLTLGAAVNMNRVINSPEIRQHFPLLVEAARSVASYQLRTRATIVGNLCNASPAGDTTGACIVLDGNLSIHGVGGIRQQSLSTFFLGPGQTALGAGEIAMELKFPLPPEKHAARYIKLGRNAAGDLAIVGVTVLGFPDQSVPSGYRFRIALASVAPIPLVPLEAEMILSNKPINSDSIFQAANEAMEACSPIDDVRGSARYRKMMVRNLTQKALTEVWEKIR
jgi:CO/xanthine dehydrogenase FAD-binding subunit